MSGFSFPNAEDDLKTRLIYTVAAEFVYRLDEFLEEAHATFDYWSLPVEMVSVVKECASLGADILRLVIEAPGVPLEVSWEGETPGVLSILSQSPVDLMTGAVEAVNAANEAVALGDRTPSATPTKAKMMTALATSFFYMLGEVCGLVDELDNRTVENSDVQMIRAYIDATLGMLSELNRANWSDGQPVPPGLVAGLGEHLDSYQLECAGRNAEYAASYVHEAVKYAQ